MAILVETKLMTAEEFFERAPQDRRSELVRGKIVTRPFLTVEQGEAVSALAAHLAKFIHDSRLGRSYAATGFVIARHPDTVRSPSFAFVSKTALPLGAKRDFFFQGAPDLAVEVASPDESAEDIQDKVLDYLTAGTRMVLYLHPRSKTITVYRSLDDIRVLTLRDTLDGGDVLPGLSVPLEEIFVD